MLLVDRVKRGLVYNFLFVTTRGKWNDYLDPGIDHESESCS